MPINSEGELLLGVHASASIWKVGSTFVAIQGTVLESWKKS